jgi:hypothetical protein
VNVEVLQGSSGWLAGNMEFWKRMKLGQSFFINVTA